MTRRSTGGKLGGQGVTLIASLLYVRYSKRRYLKFYRVFNRFVMECLLHETLMFWGHPNRKTGNERSFWSVETRMADANALRLMNNPLGRQAQGSRSGSGCLLWL